MNKYNFCFYIFKEGLILESSLKAKFNSQSKACSFSLLISYLSVLIIHRDGKTRNVFSSTIIFIS